MSNHVGYNSHKKDDWRKFLPPLASRIAPPRRPRGIVSYGPSELRLRENMDVSGGPQTFVRNNPQLFATSSTSAHEGWFYWGCLKVIGPEYEYGKNGLLWRYQSKVRGAAGGPGGSIVDFLIENLGRGVDDLGVRIVTPFFHTGSGALNRGSDFEQIYTLLDAGVFVVDVYSVNYMSDPTGRAVIKAVEGVLQMRADYSPLYRRSTD